MSIIQEALRQLKSVNEDKDSKDFKDTIGSNTLKTLRKYGIKPVNKGSKANEVDPVDKNVTGLQIKDNEVTACGLDKSEVIIPDNVTSIGFRAFQFSPDTRANLTTVRLPSSLETIKGWAFLGCEKLKNINLQDTQLESVGKRAFNYCAFESITLPDTIKIIDNAAFESCNNLKKVVIEGKLSKVGKDIFNNCLELDEIKLNQTEDELATIDGGQQFLKELTDLTYAKVKVIFETETKESLNEVRGNKASYWEPLDGEGPFNTIEDIQLYLQNNYKNLNVFKNGPGNGCTIYGDRRELEHLISSVYNDDQLEFIEIDESINFNIENFGFDNRFR